MIKKFISMGTAVLLMASGISFIGMTSANASAPTLTDLGYFDGGPRSMPGFSSSTTTYAVTANSNSVFITIANSPGGSTQVHTCKGSVITPGGSPPCFLSSGANTYTIVVSQGGLSTTYTITFNYSPPAPVNLGLSSSSTIKGASISSLGVGNRDPLSVTRGSVTLTSTQAADVSNSGSFVTAFSAVSGSAEIASINKYARGVTPFYVGGPTSLNIYNGTAALSDGDFFQVAVASISNGGNYLWYIIEVTVTAGGGGGSSSSGLTPLFTSGSSLDGRYTVQVSNYDSAYTYAVTSTAGQASINSSGLVTVTGLSKDQSVSVTVTTTRTGYSSASGSVSGRAQVAAMTPSNKPTVTLSDTLITCTIGSYSATPTSSAFSLFVDGKHVSTIFSALGDYLPDWIIPWATSSTITRTASLTSATWAMSDAYKGKGITCATLAYSKNAIGFTASQVMVAR